MYSIWSYLHLLDCKSHTSIIVWSVSDEENMLMTLTPGPNVIKTFYVHNLQIIVKKLECFSLEDLSSQVQCLRAKPELLTRVKHHSGAPL